MAALDRTPVDLLTLPPADALECVAVWLDDCDTHLALRVAGGLPMPPFSPLDAFVVVQETANQVRRLLAALDARNSDSVKPDYQPGDEIVLWTTPGEVMGQLAHREWFEPARSAA